ncbi:MAG: hypothetical protein M3P49_14620 [Actinomycetota bacterium]|nr:hypothetical protein [Actinomycetota bacterium]
MHAYGFGPIRDNPQRNNLRPDPGTEGAQEFYPVAHLGFRMWRFDPLREVLCSTIDFVTVGYIDWEMDGVMEASCAFKKCDPVPNPSHTCGIYARNSPDKVISGEYATTITRARFHYGAVKHRPHVAGVIAAWGEVEHYDEGFKASRARILCLFEPEEVRTSWAPSFEVDPSLLPAFYRMCERHKIPVLPRKFFTDPAFVRLYAEERGLVLAEDLL